MTAAKVLSAVALALTLGFTAATFHLLTVTSSPYTISAGTNYHYCTIGFTSHPLTCEAAK